MLRLARAYREQHGRRWISAMPTNLYGPFDNFDPETSLLHYSIRWQDLEGDLTKLHIHGPADTESNNNPCFLPIKSRVCV